MVKKTGLSALDAQAGHASGIGMVQPGGSLSAPAVEERGAQQQQAAGAGVGIHGDGRQRVLTAAHI